MRTFLPRIAWVFLALLGVSMFMLSLGKDDLRVSPSAVSTGPSGTAAFIALLKAQGYDVVIDRSPKPKIRPTDTVITFWAGSDAKPQEGDEDEGESDTRTKIVDHIYEQVAKGSQALFFEIPENFLTLSPIVYRGPAAEVRERGSTRVFQVKTLGAANQPIDYSEDYSAQILGTSDGTDFLRAVQYGEGTYVWAYDGSFATNRLIGQVDHAEVLSRLVAAVTKPKGRIVVAEAVATGATSIGLLESIGPWADAAWRQTIFLAFVIVMTLGRRFGLPEADRRKLQGGRDLAVAISDTLSRGRNARLALNSEIQQAESLVRSHLRLARDAELELRSDRIPQDLRIALAEAKSAALADRVPLQSAMQCIRRLHAALADSGFRR